MLHGPWYLVVECQQGSIEVSCATVLQKVNTGPDQIN